MPNGTFSGVGTGARRPAVTLFRVAGEKPADEHQLTNRHDRFVPDNQPKFPATWVSAFDGELL